MEPNNDDEIDRVSLMWALMAIRARIQGEFDHPQLVPYGPLSTDTTADVLRIADLALSQERAARAPAWEGRE